MSGTEAPRLALTDDSVTGIVKTRMMVGCKLKNQRSPQGYVHCCMKRIEANWQICLGIIISHPTKGPTFSSSWVSGGAYVVEAYIAP